MTAVKGTDGTADPATRYPLATCTTCTLIPWRLMRSTTTQRKKRRIIEEFLNTETKNTLLHQAMVSLRDWRQALQTPHVYRVGNSTLRIQSQCLALVLVLLIVCLFLFAKPALFRAVCSPSVEFPVPVRHFYTYNRTYPLTNPVKTSAGISFRIAIISDLDTESKVTESKDGHLWQSLMKRGTLFWMPDKNFISVNWDKDIVSLTSTLSAKGRGMELSELITFDGKLVTFDDRSGIVYFIEGDAIYPWVILMDGNGKSTKGFKSEWATVKDEQLYVGSMGKEWTTDLGEYVHNNPQWVKIISPRGEIHSLNWISNFKRLRQAIDIEFPGYMIHESGVWSDIHRSWFFLPRRCSKEQYNDNKDEYMSCNVLLVADEHFVNIKVTKIGTVIPIRGFSSFKFLPGSQDRIIVALKTEEYEGKTATYITAFTIDGAIIMPDLRIIDKKFEGLEFI